ncbi:hypothetical protein SAMN05421874_12227 [Nonomuraea maritima]|uniref:Uncharacterized protein n=1 Tax=Nonomuraea maritima TaxID=683260 RepID=A0A1G9KBB8_9ACTN|nr:hypothetical protein SAMN05421874_12227 [Nonomuraea maritima]
MNAGDIRRVLLDGNQRQDFVHEGLAIRSPGRIGHLHTDEQLGRVTVGGHELSGPRSRQQQAKRPYDLRHAATQDSSDAGGHTHTLLIHRGGTG